MLLLLLACGGGGSGDRAPADDDTTNPEVPQTWYADTDDDGFGDAANFIEAVKRPDGYVLDHADCDDNDQSIHPDAAEVCNDGLDQDCSGTDLTCQTWYTDTDKDGFGDAAAFVVAEKRPVGYVSDHADCNDNDQSIHPDAAEVCNDSIDQDCNGTDLICQTWYADADKDGFGDAAASVLAENPPEGYVSDDSDCDDTDQTIHPDGTETCGDGLDQDCSGADQVCDPDPVFARFGVITDIHHTNRPDTKAYKFSAALAKTAYFVETMNTEAVDFIIELGDFVAEVVDPKDPVENFEEVDTIFTGFEGPYYHVWGNHEFDSLTRADLLANLENSGIPADRTYYSFDHGGIHGIVLDANFTNAEPHTPFDMLQEGDIEWWDWKDAWIPQAELDWLVADLAAANRPTVVFTHQVLHRDSNVADPDDFAIKNADEIRALLESDGQVLAVFTGHAHGGEMAIRNDIHYFGIVGNIGLFIDWSTVSPTNGLDPQSDCPFALVEIEEIAQDKTQGTRTYQIELKGNAQQDSYVDEVEIVMP